MNPARTPLLPHGERQQETIEDQIYYPESDGEPMAESDFQRDPLTYAVNALRIHFAHRPDVYVSGNMFVYYEEDNPSVAVAPDVFVVFGVPNHNRTIFKTWREGKTPDFVLEITSRRTHREDEKEKPAKYQGMGVQEYFQYDPTGDYLRPALKGQRLDAAGIYQPVVVQVREDGTLYLPSQVLGLELHLEQGHMRLFDPLAGHYLLTHEQEFEARRRAEDLWQAEAEARHREAEARRRAEARLKELEAELARLRGSAGNGSNRHNGRNGQNGPEGGQST